MSREQREHELQGEVPGRAVGRVDPAEQQPIVVRRHRRLHRREARVEARRLRRGGDAAVGPAVRIADDGQRSADEPLERLAAAGQRVGQLPVVERRERVVSQRVEPDRHPRGCERVDVAGAHPRVLGIGTGVSEQRLGPAVARVPRQLLGGTAEAMDLRPLENAGRSASRRLRHDPAGIDGALKPLPPEGERRLERAPGEKERRGEPESREDRQSQRCVRGEVVVERHRRGEPFASSSRLDGVGELACVDDAVAAGQMPELGLVERDAVRRNELDGRVAAAVCDAVKRDGHAGTQRRLPKHELDHCGNRLSQHGDEGTRSALQGRCHGDGSLARSNDRAR